MFTFFYRCFSNPLLGHLWIVPQGASVVIEIMHEATYNDGKHTNNRGQWLGL